MAELQLNKPLYKPVSGDAAQERPALVRPARPSLMPRMGAVLVDLLLLHFVYLLLLKLAPEIGVRLGRAGEWIGLAGAWLYFAVCSSHLTWGRSLGKVFMRLQVSEDTGPDLAFGRAALRAALLLSGCVVTIALGQYSVQLQKPGIIDPLPTFLATLGWAINVGWLIGNLLFSAYEPFGRTFYDYIVGSVVTASDSDPTLLQEHLANLREAIGTPPPKRCYIALGASLVIVCTLVTPQYIRARDQLQSMSRDERERLVQGHALFEFPGFRGPSPTGRFEKIDGSEDTASTAAAVLAAILSYNQVGTIDLDTLKKDPAVTGFHERAIKTARTEKDFRDSILGLHSNLNMNRTRSEQPATTIPRLLRLELNFAEKADLFFASNIVPKYSVSQKLELDPGDLATSRLLSLREVAKSDPTTTGG